jgi:hypothetical protein
VWQDVSVRVGEDYEGRREKEVRCACVPVCVFMFKKRAALFPLYLLIYEERKSEKKEKIL